MSEIAIVFPEVFPVIETERLFLRPLRETDAPMLFRLRSEPEAIRFLDRHPMKDLSEAEAFIQNACDRYPKNQGIDWAIDLKESGMPIGTVALWRFEPENFRAECGYNLLTEQQGKGYMTEALASVIRFAFDSLNVHTIMANINPNNRASEKLLERMGFIREAYFRQDYYFDGKFLDSAIYGLLKGEEKI